MEVYAGIQVLRGMGRIPATFAHGADFAVFLVFTVPLCWYLMTLPETRWPFRLLLAGISFVGFLCILLTGTRSGYLGAGVMVLGAFVLFPRLRIPVASMVAASVLIFLALWPYLTDLRGEIGRKFHFESGKGQMGVEVSTSTRILTLDVAQRIVRKNPLLGIGIGSFRREMISYIPKEYRGYFVHTTIVQKGGRVAHNAFADVWTETGTLGFLAFLILVGMGVWNLVHLIRRGPAGSSHLAKFLIVAYVGTFVTGFLHGGFLVSQYCWLYLGMGFGLAKVGKAETDQAPSAAHL
jgi:O-antigen ligase